MKIPTFCNTQQHPLSISRIGYIKSRKVTLAAIESYLKIFHLAQYLSILFCKKWQQMLLQDWKWQDRNDSLDCYSSVFGHEQALPSFWKQLGQIVMEIDGTAWKLITSTWIWLQASALYHRYTDRGTEDIFTCRAASLQLKNKIKIATLKFIVWCFRKNLLEQAMWPAPDGWGYPGQLLQSRFWWVLVCNPVVKNVFK